MFDGLKGWKDWSVVMRSYTGAAVAGLGQHMARVETMAIPALNLTLDQQGRQVSEQLYYILVMTCRGSALTRVITCGTGEGLEGWRQLCVYHEPKTATRHAGLLLELLGYSFEGEIDDRLTQFERDLNRYESSANDTVTDNMRIGIVLRQLPEGPLKQHLIMNSEKFVSWQSMKEEISNVRRSQAAAMSWTHANEC